VVAFGFSPGKQFPRLLMYPPQFVKEAVAKSFLVLLSCIHDRLGDVRFAKCGKLCLKAENLSEVLIEFHASDQILKPRVLTNRIKEWMHFEELQNVGLLLVGPLKPDKCLVIVTESQVGVNEGASRNKITLPAALQFMNQAKGFCAVPGPRVCGCQQLNGPWTSMHHSCCFFELKDRFFGPVLTNQGEAQEPVGAGFVGVHREYAAKFLNSLVIAMRLK
jgi:hypothetical protein